MYRYASQKSKTCSDFLRCARIFRHVIGKVVSAGSDGRTWLLSRPPASATADHTRRHEETVTARRARLPYSPLCALEHLPL